MDEFETTDPALSGEMTITITQADADGGTDLVAVHDGLPPGVSTADNEIGWRLSLERLAALVETRRGCRLVWHGPEVRHLRNRCAQRSETDVQVRAACRVMFAISEICWTRPVRILLATQPVQPEAAYHFSSTLPGPLTPGVAISNPYHAERPARQRIIEDRYRLGPGCAQIDFRRVDQERRQAPERQHRGRNAESAAEPGRHPAERKLGQHKGRAKT